MSFLLMSFWWLILVSCSPVVAGDQGALPDAGAIGRAADAAVQGGQAHCAGAQQVAPVARHARRKQLLAVFQFGLLQRVRQPLLLCLRQGEEHLVHERASRGGWRTCSCRRTMMFPPGAEATAESCECSHHDAFETTFCLKKSLLHEILPTSAPGAAALAGARRPARRVLSDAPSAMDLFRLDRRLQHCPYRAQQREQRHAVQESALLVLSALAALYSNWTCMDQSTDLIGRSSASRGTPSSSGAPMTHHTFQDFKNSNAPFGNQSLLKASSPHQAQQREQGHAVQKGALLLVRRLLYILRMDRGCSSPAPCAAAQAGASRRGERVLRRHRCMT